MNARKSLSCLHRHLLLFIGLLLTMTVSAQSITVTGVVTDAAGETIIGANVTVKGTTNGSITDMDGRYTLSNVSPSGVLVFSYIGYKNQEVACDGRRTINVTLSEDSQSLDEVIVVGYGSLRRT